MEAAVIILAVLVAIVLGVMGFFLGRLWRFQPQQPQPGQPQPGTQPQPPDPAALRQQRLEAARNRRANLEQRVAEEETFLFEEEEVDFLREELNQLRQARRNRRQRPQGQQGT